MNIRIVALGLILAAQAGLAQESYKPAKAKADNGKKKSKGKTKAKAKGEPKN